MKKRVISLLLVLTLCLGLLPTPALAEEAPTSQTQEETPVSQNEEGQEPQEEPTPQSQEGKESQQEPTPQSQEGQESQQEPPPQGQESQQPQPEPDPQDGETPQPPQGEPEQEEPPVRRVLKANAPMAVAEGKTGENAELYVGAQEGKLFAGVGGNATFWVDCENGDLNSLTAVFEGAHPGLSTTISDGIMGRKIVTVKADNQAKTGEYQLILTSGKAKGFATVVVNAPITVEREIKVVLGKNSATLTVNVEVAEEIDRGTRERIISDISYMWMYEDGGEIGRRETNELIRTPADLIPNPEAPAVYSRSVYCWVTCDACAYSATTSPVVVTINTCDHTQPTTYDRNGLCEKCKESCGADKPFITGDGVAIQIPQNAATLFALDSYFPGTLYLWEDYTRGTALRVGTLNGDGTLALQDHNVSSELILDDFQNHSFTIQNGSLFKLTLNQAGSLILDDVTIENHVRFYGPANLTGGTFKGV